MKKNLIYLLFIAMAVLMCSCGDDADEPALKDQVMFVGETYKILDNSWNWSSENKLIASVSQGIVTAKLVGTTRIHKEDGTKSFQVTVKPRYYYFSEPCIQWGANMDAVRTYMFSYRFSDGDESMISYYGTNKEDFYSYLFDSDQKLTDVIVEIKKSELTTDQLLNYLSERYVKMAIGADESEVDLEYFFKSIDGKTIIDLIDYHDYSEYYVWYFEYNTQNSPAKKSEIESVLTNKTTLNLHKHMNNKP